MCHMWLLDVLAAGDWGSFVGEAFADMLARQWLTVVQKQRFALRTLAVYGSLLETKCQSTELVGYAKAACIVEIAAAGIGVTIPEWYRQVLYRLKAGEFPVRR
jgi:hypothetical protein